MCIKDKKNELTKLKKKLIEVKNSGEQKEIDILNKKIRKLELQISEDIQHSIHRENFVRSY